MKYSKYIIIVSLLIVLSAIAGYYKYLQIFSPNTHNINSLNEFVYIPTGTDYPGFLEIIKGSRILADYNSFEKIAKLKKLSTLFHPGRYKIKNGMNNNDLVNTFRSGKQSPVKLTFNNLRTKADFARVISSQIEADSISIINFLNNKENLIKYEIDSQNLISYFIPNTYEFYWNTNAEQLIERLLKEYKVFWNTDRKEKAGKLGMNSHEVSILASIIDEETEKNTEKPTIAGVYINRLKNGIPLQADPTIKYALKDSLRQRITLKDLEIDSPYNTYKFTGLPPGPLRIASIASIDAVLNYEKHSYYYFCAKDDFSGYHAFAETLRQHNVNARKYHNALNKRRIYK